MMNRIQFKHFLGSFTKWKQNIAQKKWYNALVFGKVWMNEDETPTWAYKIYAGNVSVDSSTIDYIYEVPTKQQIDNIEQSIKDIQNLINIDNDSSRFTNQNFVNAIQYVVDDVIHDISVNIDNILDHLQVIDSSIHNIDSSVQSHENCLNWVIKN